MKFVFIEPGDKGQVTTIKEKYLESCQFSVDGVHSALKKGSGSKR